MFYVLLFVVFILHVAFALSNDCEDKWDRVGDKCIWKSSEVSNRALNLKRCREMGGTLVSPRTVVQNELLRENLGSDNSDYWLSGQLYIPNNNPLYMWIDGEPISHSDWVPSFPIRYDTSSGACIYIKAQEGWYDDYCSREHKQMCEKPIKSLQYLKYQEKNKTSDATVEFLRKLVVLVESANDPKSLIVHRTLSSKQQK